MLNPYIWELYKKTEGQKVIDIFREGIYNKLSDEYIDTVSDLHGFYCANHEVVEETRNGLIELKQNMTYDSSYVKPEKDVDLYIDGEDIDGYFEDYYDALFEKCEHNMHIA